MTRTTKYATVAWTAITLLALLAGCAGGDHGHSHGEDGSHDTAAGDTEAPAVLDLTAEAQEILAKADLADGTQDQVVAKCPGCNLAMDGSADHAANVGEYELHFCSEGCSRRFQEDTDAAIMALATP